MERPKDERGSTNLAAPIAKESYNDPALHEDIHERISMITLILTRCQIWKKHRWQREHIAKGDQPKEGYPLNI